jgi:hypothetical protein
MANSRRAECFPGSPVPVRAATGYIGVAVARFEWRSGVAAAAGRMICAPVSGSRVGPD